MTLRLAGSTSGYAEIDAPAVAGNNTLILPTGNGASGQILSTNGSGTLSWADGVRMTLATSQASTSGTAISFTSIPSWVKRITVMLNSVSTSGVNPIQVQLGNSTGYVVTGYTATSTINGQGAVTSTSGLVQITSAAASNYIAHHIITLFSGTIWVGSGVSFPSGGLGGYFSGSIDVGGTLDRLRVTTVGGTDTFDAGSINIMYEG